MMDVTLKWGILGTGRMGRSFAAALAHAEGARLVAVASRDSPQSEAAFGEARMHQGYQSLLADPEVQAVYIATPHPTHAEWAIKAAEAGKHILCEKPLGMNAAEASAIIEAARTHDVFLMEGFMYRLHPQTAKLIELVQSGRLGRIHLVQATFGYGKPFDAAARQYANDLGGGGILDVGCYCVSMARLIAGVVSGSQIAEPAVVQAAGKLGPTGTDDYAVATLQFADGLIAQLSTSVALPQNNTVTLFGTNGRIEVASPWFCSGVEGGRSVITVVGIDERREDIAIETDRWLYAIEAEHVAAQIAHRQGSWPASSWADTLGNMRVLDQWRRAIGLEYDVEKPGGRPLPLSGRPLKRRANAAIPQGHVPGLAAPISRLALGCMSFSTLPDASVMYDAFFEAGGTVFDTAHRYLNGRADVLLGQWMEQRGVRDSVTVIGKGGHTPNCNPQAVTRELHESLASLRTDRIDIYFLHRDNPEIPVGEFVDVLDEHQRAGRIGIFGGSNWSIERMEAANAYAAKHGRQGMTVLSNHFSLAEMLEPMWADCIACSDAASTAWLRQTGTPLFAWSSQARGFFTDRAGPGKREDAAMVRTWYSDLNFARRERAAQLATELGTSMLNIALAYVLAQEFPVFPIIGPLTLDELRGSLGALNIRLTPAQIRWLRDGDLEPVRK
jgi:predicted dehydrogenase/aryl-alcohol dehydrogenase-like predicted oxidoreductase